MSTKDLLLCPRLASRVTKFKSLDRCDAARDTIPFHIVLWILRVFAYDCLTCIDSIFKQDKCWFCPS